LKAGGKARRRVGKLFRRKRLRRREGGKYIGKVVGSHVTGGKSASWKAIDGQVGKLEG